MIETFNPATGELVASYQEHTVDDIARFADEAHNRYLEWRLATYAERATYLMRIADLLRSVQTSSPG